MHVGPYIAALKIGEVLSHCSRPMHRRKYIYLVAPSTASPRSKRHTIALRKRVLVEKQKRSFFSMKKKATNRNSWTNPTAEERVEIVENLDEYIVID